MECQRGHQLGAAWIYVDRNPATISTDIGGGVCPGKRGQAVHTVAEGQRGHMQDTFYKRIDD